MKKYLLAFVILLYSIVPSYAEFITSRILCIQTVTNCIRLEKPITIDSVFFNKTIDTKHQSVTEIWLPVDYPGYLVLKKETYV